jgi:hypothetical protein
MQFLAKKKQLIVFFVEETKEINYKKNIRKVLREKKPHRSKRLAIGW